MEDYKFPWPENLRAKWRGPGAAQASQRRVPLLFTPIKFREVELKNRVAVSPMCMYSSRDGFFNDWHLSHLSGFARGGAGLVFCEATAVTPEGRITPWDAGLWKDEQIEGFKRAVDLIHALQCRAGMQLAHAGRKASTYPPFFDHAGSSSQNKVKVEPADGGWEPVAPSALKWDESYPQPRELTRGEIRDLIQAFVSAAKRADKAGFDVLEVHGAHGYLISEFNSPLANKRTDEYGGSFENRTRLCLEVVEAVRAAWPPHKPLFVRLSCDDWVPGGWSIGDTVRLAAELKQRFAVDLIDCSSGGQSPLQRIPERPGFQVPFARAVREQAKIATGAVGKITNSQQAEQILVNGDADLVFIARQFLRDPHFALHAAKELGVTVDWALQYERAAM